jgi:exonuclease III
MKLLAWNLNHRAARRRLPLWIAAAINEQAPDILVLTEYVEGADHLLFLTALKAKGLCEFSCSIQPGHENQILIATRGTHCRCELILPEIHPSVRSNILQVVLPDGLTIIGFRMPAFNAKDRPLKRLVWNWLLSEADRLRGSSAIIVGDFNTAPADPRAQCGDCLEELVQSGWQHPRPASGYSWRGLTGAERQIDHIFLSRRVAKGVFRSIRSGPWAELFARDNCEPRPT